uniref:PHD-type domain-containing protein n=2 Tax=Oryza meridionalis TaxID=40149 RepID=A0A0E0CZD9_9ORYZ
MAAAAAGSSDSRKPAAHPPSRDFLVHVEAYLSRRDGVDKLLKISRYAARLALAAGPLPPAASARLKSFESSVGLSRKAFRLGKFVQNVNALRAHPHPPPALALLAYGGEGVYYFLEQFVWLAKAGLLPAHLLPRLQRLSAWAELLGYVGSIRIKLEEIRKLESSVKVRLKEGCGEESDVVRTLRGKLLLKRMSVVQDVADAVMALGDVTDGKGLLGSSTLMASAGLLSALISAHKNWNSSLKIHSSIELVMMEGSGTLLRLQSCPVHGAGKATAALRVLGSGTRRCRQIPAREGRKNEGRPMRSETEQSARLLFRLPDESRTRQSPPPPRHGTALPPPLAHPARARAHGRNPPKTDGKTRPARNTNQPHSCTGIAAREKTGLQRAGKGNHQISSGAGFGLVGGGGGGARPSLGGAGMGKGGEGAVPVGESGGRRRRRLGEDGGDDDDEEYVVEEDEVEECDEDLSASSAGEGGEGTDEEYEEGDEDEEEDETPRPRQPVKSRENGRKGKADPPMARSRRRKYEDDDDYSEEEDDGVDEYDEDLEEEEEEDDEAPRSKRMKKRGGRNVERYEEDMDFDPDMDEEEEEEDVDFDPEVEDEEEEDFEDEEEDELEATKVRVKNMRRRKSALNQRRGKKKSSSKMASRKVGSVKARKAASVRRRQKKRSMLDRYEDDDFIVEDEVTADWQPRKKARIRKQMEVDPLTPVFEAETWPTVDSDTTDFEFVTSDEEAAIAEPTRVIKKGRKKRVFVSDSSSDSEFVVSDKELENLKESEPPESLKVLPSSPRKISVTGNGEHKGKEKNEPQEAGRATCGICLSEEQRVTVQGVLDCCSHYFCFACIMQWSKVESRCPLCKRRFTTITKSSKEDTGLELTNSVIRVEERDQVYQPTEEEIRRWLDPYENVVCIECNQGGDDSLMLLCDICDSSAHTYCVGLGREVPEGNWYCGGCRLDGEGHSYHNHVNGNSGMFGAISPIGTFERQGIDLNVPPREIPRGNHSVESQASTAGASTPSVRQTNATNFRRRQMHDWIRSLLSRPRTTLRPVMHHNGVNQSGFVPSTEPDHMNFCAPLESDTLHNTWSVPRSEPSQNFHVMSEASTSETSFGRHAALSERRQIYERFFMLLSRPSPTIRPDLCHNASEHGGSIPRVEPNHMNFHAPPVANSPQTLLDGIPNHSNGFSFTQAHSNFVDGNNFQGTEGV